MGKFSNKLIENGRLTGLHSNGNDATATSRNRFDRRIDARLHLNSQQRLSTVRNGSKIELFTKRTTTTTPRDARQLLLNRQQQGQIKNMIKKQVSSDHEASAFSLRRAVNQDRKQRMSEPLIIVTGLGNVRKEGNKLKVIKKPLDDNKHTIVSDGVNTLITLNNERAYKSDGKYNQRYSEDEQIDYENELEEEDESDEEEEFGVESRSKNKYEPTNIRITNNLKKKTYQQQQQQQQQHYYHHQQQQQQQNKHLIQNTSVVQSKSSPLVEQRTKMRVEENFGAAKHLFRVPYSQSSKQFEDVQMMDYENNLEARAIHSSLPTTSSGYKLIISNLHPKVTEDDILVRICLRFFFKNKYTL
jgi:hypothetical protein